MTEPVPERHRVSHFFNIAVFVVGVGFLIWMIHGLGLDNAVDVLRSAGRWFFVVVALDLAGMACDAAAIHAFMQPEARMVSFWRVLAANASGRAINILTPGGALGEATKVTMLVGHAPRARAVSAIVLFDLAGFYLSVAIVLIGVPLTLSLVELPHDLRVVVWIGLGMLAPIVIGLAVLVHRGALGTVLDAAARLGILSRARADALAAKLADIDRHLGELQHDRTAGTRVAFAWMILSRLISWSATTIILRAIGVPITAPLLVGIFSVGILIGWVSNVVPLGLGIADGSNYALYDVLGASGAHGVFMTMLGRARNLVLALLGLATMGVAHTINRVSIERRHRRLAERIALRSSRPESRDPA